MEEKKTGLKIQTELRIEDAVPGTRVKLLRTKLGLRKGTHGTIRQVLDIGPYYGKELEIQLASGLVHLRFGTWANDLQKI